MYAIRSYYETDEDNREAGDEAQAVVKDRQTQLRAGMWLLQLVEGDSGNIGDVRRNYSQDTRREEGE